MKEKTYLLIGKHSRPYVGEMSRVYHKVKGIFHCKSKIWEEHLGWWPIATVVPSGYVTREFNNA